MSGLDGLPPSNVVKYMTEFGSIVAHASGTEPKLKTYISVTDKNEMIARQKEQQIFEKVSELIN